MDDSTKSTASSTKDVQLTSPPPPKKLKQACLPFKVLTPKDDANVVSPKSQKKRKLPGDASGPVKAPKTQRSIEKKTTKAASEDVENEELKQDAKKAGPLEKFVKSKKEEKKADVPSIIVDLTEPEEKEEESKETDGDAAESAPKDEVSEKSEEKEDDKSENLTTEKEDEEKSNDKSESSEENEKDEEDEEEKDESERKESDKDEKKDSLAPAAQNELKSPAPSKPKSAKTPASARKSLSKEERERIKKEREEKKLKEKEEKERQKQEEKERKEREKEEKKRKLEEEKKEKLEQKKKEQEEKLKQKEEEKKRKQEEKRLEQEKKEKEQERLKEEKRLEKQKLKEEKELEKQKAELEKLKVTKAQKSMFQSFFTKKAADDVEEVQTPECENGLFMPFQVKADTKLAPLIRVEKAVLEERLKKFDELFETQDTEQLYLKELKESSDKKIGTCGSTWPYEPEDSCCMLLEEEGDKPAKPKTDRMKAKFLKFHENYRPAYYGTWKKLSDSVTPRRPFGKDTAILDYEVDSDEEWEEEEPGESLSGPEDEEEEEEENKEDDDEDDDGFYVPHGYLSEGEGCEDEEDDDVTPERLKARQLAKAKAFEMEQSKKKVEVLKPQFVGICWDEPGKKLNFMEEVLIQYKMVLLHSAGKVPIPVVEKRDDESLEAHRRNRQSKQAKTSQNVPQEAYPDLIRLVHGNRLGLPRLIKKFREFWHLKETGQKEENKDETKDAEANKDDPKSKPDKDQGLDDSISKPDKEGSPDVKTKKYSISKRQLDITIKEMGVYEKRPKFSKFTSWYVNDDVLEKYGLKNWLVPLPEPEAPSPTSGRSTPKLETPKQITNSITKFTKAGITPKVHKPTPVKPTEPTGTPKSAGGGGGGKKRILDMFSKAQQKPRKLLAPGIATENIIKLEGESEDSDCAIVGVDLKADSKQPSVKSMFKPEKRKSGDTKDEATEPKQPRLEADTPVESKPDDKATKAGKTSDKQKTNPKGKATQEAKEKPKKTPAKQVAKKDAAEKEAGKKTPATKHIVKKKTATEKEGAKKTPGQKKLNVVKKTKPAAETEKKSGDSDKPKGAGTEGSPMEID